jgi:hypothetical protein
MPDRDKFVWNASNVVVSQCMLCKHTSPEPYAVCSAFPGSIPPEILANQVDHRKPWIDATTGQPGDEGVPLAGSILFEPRPGVNPVALARLYEVLDAVGS